MTIPAAAASAEPDRRPGWIALTASERGASHVAVKTPNQDAVAVEPIGLTGLVAAVADGHGHTRHLRSARGSKLAVEIGCQVSLEIAELLEPGDDPADAASTDDPRASGSAADLAGTGKRLAELAEDLLVPEIVARWRAAVLDDVAKDPFSEAEQERRRKGDDETIAYGSTLLLCIALPDWLILAQIGDGDVIGVRIDGSLELPVPMDPALDGLVTTSLCGKDPISDFRVAVVSAAQTPLLALMLATDGYGNAQMLEEWPTSFSKDMAWLLRERDTAWIETQLPTWAARCASADGSADDTTVALLISPAGLAARPVTPPGSFGTAEGGFDPDADSDEITIPAAIRTDTVPSGTIPSGSSGSGAASHGVEPGPADQMTAERVTADQMRVELLEADQSESEVQGSSQADEEPQDSASRPSQSGSSQL
ncbi:MAG TPA: protein phosphatase 2C domain-containing protein [Streptosporangiaceae bacterium]|nr:protein phosphatase 2C domain-containing protein [Streptosporangiaceae bacterium]